MGKNAVFYLDLNQGRSPSSHCTHWGENREGISRQYQGLFFFFFFSFMFILVKLKALVWRCMEDTLALGLINIRQEVKIPMHRAVTLVV